MSERVERLRVATQARHDTTLGRAKNTLASMTRRETPVTFRSVAEAAGVSRSWLYRQPELREQINRLRHTSQSRPGPLPSDERATVGSLRQQVRTYRDEINRLRTENHQLREHLVRRLGTDRAAAVTKRP
jgi:Family of unknown function (DUF6262)